MVHLSFPLWEKHSHLSKQKALEAVRVHDTQR